MISEFPLLVFTVLTGLAAGGYAMAAVFHLAGGRKERSWTLPLVCLVCLAAGMVAVLFHLGHPERFLNALANPTAMIAQEAYWSIPLGIVLLLDAVLLKLGKGQTPALPVIGAVLSLGLMTVTAIAYFTSYGVAGWPEVPTLPLFVAGDLGMGAAFALAMDARGSNRSAAIVSAVLAVAVAVTMVAEAAVFAPLPVGAVPFAVAAVLAVAGAVLEVFPSAKPQAWWRWLAFACLLAAVTVARYGFYAAV